MPISKLEVLPNQGAWGIWHIEETQKDLFNRLPTTDQCQKEYLSISHPTKQLEWLSSRLTVKGLMEAFELDYQGLFKDGFGKPHLRHCDWSISIAHCYPFAAAAINQAGPIGIDIEKPRTQLLKIASRFLNETELELAGEDLDKLCHYWTAKEALYKIHGRKRLVFREHISLKTSEDAQYQGFINANNESHQFAVHFYRLQEHLIALSRK